MPDDPQRPASGQQSDPRPLAGAPPWWGSLSRVDLPEDERPPAVQLVSPPAHRTMPPRGRGWSHVQWRTWAFNLAVLGIAVLVICVGFGVLSPSMFLTVALLFGVPLTLAATTATIVARRSR